MAIVSLLTVCPHCQHLMTPAADKDGAYCSVCFARLSRAALPADPRKQHTADPRRTPPRNKESEPQ